MGPAQATETNWSPWNNPGVVYHEGSLCSLAGGGIAIDERGGVDIVVRRPLHVLGPTSAYVSFAPGCAGSSG
jgi:hypothetical protein